ncbi:MAG: iron-containing alcohol dehydrogenase family protein [Fusobacteriota bacterium]
MEISIPSLLRIKPNALYKIGKYLRKAKYKKIALFFGEGIKDLFSEQIIISLESSEIKIAHEEVVKDNDISNVFESTFSIPSGVDAMVAVGGGKVIDYCKYIAFLQQLPFISIPTSISNDGFCSPVSSLYINGKRKTLKAKIPDGVILDTKIIKDCPDRFIYSGIGDLVSNITAIRDWKMAAKLREEAVNDFAVLVSQNAVENFINYDNKDTNDIEFIRLIAGSLVMNGVSMEISKSSRPSSGSEHLISHAYDLISEKPSMHGIQVGVATYCISYVQDNGFEEIEEVLQKSGFIEYVTENPLNKEEFIKSVREGVNIKEDFYSTLSEEENIEKVLDFIENNENCKKMLV